MRRKDRFKNSETDIVNDSLECTSEVETCPDRVAEELEELLQRETISHQEYQRLRKTNRLPDNSEVTSTEKIDELATLHDVELGSTNNAKHSQSFDPFPYNENGIPVNWTSNCKQSIYDIVTLNRGEKEYDYICDEMKSVGIQITKIERLENIHLLDRFKSETEHIKKHRQLGFNMNIKYLYHGTKVDKSRICEEGLDQRLSRMGFFGKGIYFSDNPLKCIHYAKDSKYLEESYILKCRVILGEPKHFPKGEYDTSLQREPEKPNVKTGWRFYDSVVGCPRDYNEFVVYENRRAMIEYIISFQLDPRGDQELRTRLPSPFSCNSGTVTDDTHGDKIEEIRETIRRKRCIEKGEEYIPPDEEKKKRDRDLYLRLQQLHKGSQDSKGDVKEPIEVNEEKTDSIQSNKDCIDPIEEVIDSLVTDFLVVTATDNIEAAKYYIERSQMDVDKAITMYFEEML